MIELVEHLRQLIAVVGDATWRIVLTSLFYSGAELVHLLNQLDFLFCQRNLRGNRLQALCLSLAQNTADSRVGVLDEGACIAVEIDTFFRIEEHILARINLQDEVFQGTHTHNAGDFTALFFRHIVKFPQFHRGFVGIFHHQRHQIVGINHRSLAALHLTVWQLYHTIREVGQFLTPFESQTIQ